MIPTIPPALVHVPYSHSLLWSGSTWLNLPSDSWRRSGSAVECRNLDREDTVTNPLHILGPLMTTRCGGVTPRQNTIIVPLHFAMNYDLFYLFTTQLPRWNYWMTSTGSWFICARYMTPHLVLSRILYTYWGRWWRLAVAGVTPRQNTIIVPLHFAMNYD